MCGICGIAGYGWHEKQLHAMVSIQSHRGPDDTGTFINPGHLVGLGHNRLSILDLSQAAAQPMSNYRGDLRIIFNGEIYNYLELKKELGDYPFKSHGDTELILAAYEKWGLDCLEKLIGMFAFAIWDESRQQLFLARDRFGVKPLYYTVAENHLMWSSEIKALHGAGVKCRPNLRTWSNYLTYGLYEHTSDTFWEGIVSLPPGGAMTWTKSGIKNWIWYDLGQIETISEPLELSQLKARYRELLETSVNLRFRSDVPVAINLSGGVDSSILLGLVDHIFGKDSDIRAFTFTTGDDRYDETPWVRQMLARTSHPHEICRLRWQEIPELALKVQQHQDEPFGGFPTLAYSKIFERARQLGIKVLLDGQGLDEQWAGYDYYGSLLKQGASVSRLGPVQGSNSSPVRPDCLLPEFRSLSQAFHPPQPFGEALLNAQYKDARFTKIPRALRFNDRISMMHSTELREPFLDHRLFELAFSQPADRKIRNGVHKWVLREIGKELLPQGVVEAPKRPVQTPQREWLRGPLIPWVNDCLDQLNNSNGGEWLDMDRVRGYWNAYQQGESDNSFYIWQWINLALWLETQPKQYVS